MTSFVAIALIAACDPTSGGADDASMGADAAPMGADAAPMGADAEIDDGGAPIVDGGGTPPVPRVINGSFEMTTFEPGCHSNLTNDEFSAGVTGVTGFGANDQVDLYDDCYGSTSADGVFHVGLGAASRSDAIALSLDSSLTAGRSYRIRFVANHGRTGGATSTNVLVGISSSPTEAGTRVGETGLLASSPTEHEITLTAGFAASYITLDVELDGNLGWAMIDRVSLEAAD